MDFRLLASDLFKYFAKLVSKKITYSKITRHILHWGLVIMVYLQKYMEIVDFLILT